MPRLSRRAWLAAGGAALLACKAEALKLHQASYKYDTAVHKAMRAIYAFHPVNDLQEAIDTYDWIIDEAKHMLASDGLLNLRSYDKKQAIAVVKIINKAIVDSELYFRNSNILSESLATSFVDCDMMSYLSLGVLEACKLKDKIPLYATSVPFHNFLRWKQGGQSFCFESSIVDADDKIVYGKVKADKDFVDQYGFDPKRHFKIRNDNDIIAQSFFTIAAFLWGISKGENPKAIDAHEQAISLSPLNPMIRTYYGMHLLSMGNQYRPRGIFELQRAIHLGPNNPGAYVSLIKEYLKINHPSKALEYAATLMQLPYKEPKFFRNFALDLMSQAQQTKAVGNTLYAYGEIATAAIDKATASLIDRKSCFYHGNDRAKLENLAVLMDLRQATNCLRAKTKTPTTLSLNP